MEAELKFKVGDEVLVEESNYYSFSKIKKYRFETITKITATQIVTDQSRYYIKNLFQVSSSSRDKIIKIATPEVKHQIKIYQLRNDIYFQADKKNCDYENMSEEDLLKLEEIFNRNKRSNK